MNSQDQLTFFHCPNTRSTGTFILLEELGIPYKLNLINLRQGEGDTAEYHDVNLLGKVPTIVHRGTVVTEQPAVFLYLADEFSPGNLAPAIGDPLRGAYLRWMVYYGSSFEPALIDKALNREPASPAMSPYGSYESMLKNLTNQLSKGDFILGNKYSAADVLWGTSLAWTTQFKLVAETPLIKSYIERFHARPAVIRARAKEAELAAAQEKASQAKS